MDLDKAIEAAKDIEDLKPILRLILADQRTHLDAKTIMRRDLIFRDSTTGPVWIGTDGNYYRGTVSVAGETVTFTLTNLGKNEPSGG